MANASDTQPVHTRAPKLDLGQFASLKADAWWLTMSQVTDGDTGKRISNLYSAISALCQMQTMLTRECSRLLAEEAEDMSPTDREIYAMLNKI